MTIKSNSSKHYWNCQSNLFFSPKLSLQGKNVLPKILDPDYTFQREPPFLTVLKKPLLHSYDNNLTIKLQKKQISVIGKTKEPQQRQIRTGPTKKRIHRSQYQANFSKDLCKIQISSSVQRNKAVNRQSKSQCFAQKEGTLYFYLGVGNNSQLIQRILQARGNWKSTTSTLYHFRWEQIRPKYFNSSLQRQLSNHLPNHEALSDKGSLLNNMKMYCLKNNQMLFTILPVCFELDFQNVQSCQNELKRFVQFYWQDQDRINKKYMKLLKQSEEFQEKDTIAQSTVILKEKPLKASPKKGLNYYSDGCESPLKGPLYDSKKDSIKSSNSKNFRLYKKESSHSQNDNINRKKQQIKAMYKSIVSKLRPYCCFQDLSGLKKQPLSLSPVLTDVYGQTKLWLLKPTDLNRGRGIKLFRQLQQLTQYLSSYLSKNDKGSFIIQKYIQKPLLLDNRKFDIRVWAMITHNKQVYFFKQAYIRTACQQYNLQSIDQYTHLTNNAIQKNSKKYGTYQDGNQIPLHQLFTSPERKDLIMSQIKKYIRISFASAINKIFQKQNKTTSPNLLANFSMVNPNIIQTPNKVKHFQIFGYDFMLDINDHLWLIEVNTNPCLEQSSKLLEMLIPRMVDDAFKLTLDKYFAKGRINKETIPYPVQGYEDHQNLWQPISLAPNKQFENA